MPMWKVSTSEKKNVIQLSHFIMPDDGIAAGKTFIIEEWYRWGEVVIEDDTAPEQHSEPYKYPLHVSEMYVHDQELDDGVSLYFQFDDDWTDDEREYVENLYEEEGYMGLEDQGIFIDEVETAFYGPLSIEEVN